MKNYFVRVITHSIDGIHTTKVYRLGNNAEAAWSLYVAEKLRGLRFCEVRREVECIALDTEG